MILIYVFGWCYWYLLDYWLSYFSPIYVVVATHLLMHLYLKTLTSIIRTDQPTLVELTDLQYSRISFLFQAIFLRMLTFLLRFLAVVLTVFLFWIYFYSLWH